MNVTARVRGRPDRWKRVGLLLSLIVVVVVGGLLVIDKIGPNKDVDDRLDSLASVVNKARPEAAKSVDQFRNSECDSGVYEVGATFEGRTVQDRAHYAAYLVRAGWRINRSTPDSSRNSSIIEAVKRYAWGSAYFNVSFGLNDEAADVSAGYRC